MFFVSLVVKKLLLLLIVSVLHFRKELSAPPVALRRPDIAVRHIKLPDDIVAWLRLRERATAELRPLPRPWSEADFRAELLSKPWWQPEQCWIAYVENSPNESGDMIGSVTLALRAGELVTVPVVHWLLVDPAWRRRGIAGLLITHLEQAAWDAGWREIQLETHANWEAAVAFYQSIGYAEVRDASPR